MPRAGGASGPPARVAAPAGPATAPPAAPASAATPAPAGAPAAAPAGDAPAREELTLAWGDRILTSLRPAVKVYVATGRFLPTEGGTAVYAVPDRGLLARADANRGEVEDALSAHFGRPIRIRFVLEEAAGPRGSSSAAPGREPPAPAELAEEDQMASDWADMQEAPAGAATPEQRLMEAFPGAEEISP
jgi:hypothetical protein